MSASTLSFACFAKYAVFFLLTQDLWYTWYTFGTARRCEGHHRLLVLPLAEKKNHLDPLTSKAMEGKVMKEFFYWVYFFSFRKDDFKHNTTRQPGTVVHSYSPSTWEAKGR